MSATPTVVLGVEYDGRAFHGFQRQRHAASVQAALECALSQVADAPVRVAAAGRTDAGVHATQQVVSFQTAVERPVDAWRRGTSSLTPDALGVVWAKILPGAFHARFDAVARRYVYLFSDAPTRPIVHRGLVAWTNGVALDAAAMHRAAQCLLGEHDFSAFRAAACQSKSPWRRITHLDVRRANGYVAIEVRANAFLLHMVRNLAGALREVGIRRLDEAAVEELLHGRDRSLAPPTAPPQGLYLTAADYPRLQLQPRPPPLLGCPSWCERSRRAALSEGTPGEPTTRTPSASDGNRT